MTIKVNNNLGKKKNSRKPTSFKPGQSGNPKGGIPKFQTFSWFIDKYSIQTIDDLQAIDLAKIPIKEAIIIKQYIEAYMENDLKVAEWLANRSEGSPKQTIEQTGDNFMIVTPELKAMMDKASE